jgi:hypothetical protein
MSVSPGVPIFRRYLIFRGDMASLGGHVQVNYGGSRPRISFTIGDFSQADDEATH